MTLPKRVRGICPIEQVVRLNTVQSFVQSSCTECVPIRYGIMCDKSGQMTIQLDLPCVHNCHSLFGTVF